MLIDTHCHLDHPLLHDRLDEVLERGRLAGVERFIVPGVAPAGWHDIALLAKGAPNIYPAFGIHPQHAESFDDEVGAELETLLRGGIATGEIGLDYMHSDVPRSLQIAVFRAQLRLSVSHGLPVLLHCRKAFHDMLAVLKEENVAHVGGVMHAFSGSPEMASEFLRLGLYISVAGPVTYAHAVKPLEVVRRVPLDRLLLETDAPDMPPDQHRGRVNEPAFLVDIAEKVAFLKGVPLAEIARQTTSNAIQLFRRNI